MGGWVSKEHRDLLYARSVKNSIVHLHILPANHNQCILVVVVTELNRPMLLPSRVPNSNLITLRQIAPMYTLFIILQTKEKETGTRFFSLQLDKPDYS